ncbi:hypothetical protein GCM10027396_20160 [Insolitispirillum peregrinum]
MAVMQNRPGVAPRQFVDRNLLDEYLFVGESGEKVTVNAEKLLTLLARRQGAQAAAPFAIPRFDEARTAVRWFAQHTGAVTPFVELPDDQQAALLDQLEQTRQQVLAMEQELSTQPQSGDRLLYTQLMPLLLNFPQPVEYHLFQVGTQPVVTNWGMNKSASVRPVDTVGPFLAQWRQRLRDRARQAAEQAAHRQREQSFLGRLTRAGAKTGEITVSLLWNDANDLDLHVECPDGSEISFANKSACGGILDIDRNAFDQSISPEPVENIAWSQRPTVSGTYHVGVHLFRQRQGLTTSAFTVRVVEKGKARYVQGRVSGRDYLRVTSFTVP